MIFSFWTVPVLLGLALAAPLQPATIGNSEIENRDTPLNAFLALILSLLPPLGMTIDAAVGILTNFETLLASLTNEQTTYNELGHGCTAYTVLFARGTTEPGNVGILVGPPFFQALDSLVGSSAVTVQGVNNYAADIDGFLLGGSPSGSTAMAQNIQQVHASCPMTQLVVSGYSQGAQVVHNALGQLPAAVASWVSKVVVFGDPDNGEAIPNVAASKVATFCHADDAICLKADLILPAHLTYALNAPAAARFVVS